MKHTLQLLACQADAQIQLLPAFVPLADELALTFDDWFPVFLGNYRSKLTSEQVSSLEAIDRELDALGSMEDIWTEKAVRDSPQWEGIRKLAASALQSLGWPFQTPPSYAREYVKGGPTKEEDS